MRLLKDLASEAVNPYAWYWAAAIAATGLIIAILFNLPPKQY